MPRSRWFNNFRFALRAQRRHMMRTMLALLGIIVGVAAVIVMVSIGQGTQLRVYQEIESMGLNRLTITAAEIKAPPGQGQARTRAQTLSLQDVRAIARSSSHVHLIVPYRRGVFR